MALFPDIIGSRREITPVIPTVSTQLAENRVVRYRKAIRARYAFSLAWTLLTPTEARQIDDHVIAHGGAYAAFDWFDWGAFHWLWVPVGAGAGVSTVYDIDGKESSEHEFFYGSSATAVSGTVSYGTGTNGCDQVTLNVPSGEQIWCNARMRRLFNVTFEDDDQPFTREISTGHYSFATRLQQVKS